MLLQSLIVSNNRLAICYQLVNQDHMKQFFISHSAGCRLVCTWYHHLFSQSSQCHEQLCKVQGIVYLLSHVYPSNVQRFNSLKLSLKFICTIASAIVFTTAKSFLPLGHLNWLPRCPTLVQGGQQLFFIFYQRDGWQCLLAPFSQQRRWGWKELRRKGELGQV